MTQQAFFSRTGSQDFPRHLKVMLTGPPKSGKTFFLGTVPNLLILDTEPHANNLQSLAHLDVPFRAVRSMDDIRQAQFILSQDSFRAQAAEQLGMPSIDAVAIDTLDTLQGIMKRERMKEQRSTKFVRDDWAWLKEEMVSMIEAFTSLPIHTFFIVHTKTKDVGTEDNPSTIYLPGLEGSIAESIAGMVGYSLLAFRREEINPTNGNKTTKYYLQVEGDQKYEYLGNRAAGRLPSIIEPNFKTIFDTVMSNLPQQQTRTFEVQVGAGAPSGQAPASTPAAAPAPDPAPLQQGPAAEAPAAPAQEQTPVQNEAPSTPPAEAAQPATPSPEAEAAPAAQNAGQAAPASQVEAPQQVNAAALGFLQKIYAEIDQPFDQQLMIDRLDLTEARNIVMMFKALKEDEAKGDGSQDPKATMTQYLQSMNLIGEAGAADQGEQVTAKVDGNIAEVKAYVGDNLTKAQEAYDLEMMRSTVRSSLVTWLEGKGITPAPTGAAQPATPPAQPPAQQPTQQAPAAQPQASDSGQASEPAQPSTEGVTPPEEAADVPLSEEQEALVKQTLNTEVISTGVTEDSPCEVCGKKIDDVDLAELGVRRFEKVLCVADYLAETKR